MLTHVTSNRTLDEYRDLILARVDSMVMDVGQLLYEARVEHRGQWMSWVENELPFGYEKAKRLVAIYLAFRHLPEHVRERLPRPWQAMYAISRLPPEEIERGVAGGEITPSMTRSQAEQLMYRHRPLKPRIGRVQRWYQADLVVGHLVTLDPSQLSDFAEQELRRWLAARHSSDERPNQ